MTFFFIYNKMDNGREGDTKGYGLRVHNLQIYLLREVSLSSSGDRSKFQDKKKYRISGPIRDFGGSGLTIISRGQLPVVEGPVVVKSRPDEMYVMSVSSYP